MGRPRRREVLTVAAGPLFAGVELGGTKAIAVVGRGREILARHRVPTTIPSETLGLLAAQLHAWRAEFGFEGIGIASFGPLRVDPAAADFGVMLATPKPSWAGADIAAPFRALRAPLALHTDVTAAALAEGRWGAAWGLADHIYMTVGTGIGFGMIAGGRAITGALHPEAGHLRVRRLADDPFPGVCPFHGDCLEGLASGPAIAARAGRPAQELVADNPVWPFVADSLAEALLALTLTTAPRAIIIGGGVGLGAPWLLPLIRDAMHAKNAAYLAALPALAHAALGEDAGPLGAFALAQMALGYPA